MSKHRGTFKSHIGILMAIIGSAIGFGNFWRFPYLAGESGGGAFISIYIIISLVLGIPLIASEYIIGKTTHKDFIGALKELGNGRKWYLIGYITQIAVILIIGFYSVIGGWTIHALFDSLVNFNIVRDSEIIKDSFDSFVGCGWKPIALTLTFLGLSCLIVSRGIQKGAEKYNTILIPTLFMVLIVMCIYSISLPGFYKSIKFLFLPDFSNISAATILTAFGQVFFSLSIGMGIYATFASYSDKNENILKDQAIIMISDVIVAIIAGVIIFSAVFSFGINPSEGPSLIFIALPSLFSKIFLGGFIAILFYISLGIAAITSLISLLEVVITGIVDQYGLTRKKASTLTFILEAILGILCALSQADGFSIKIMGQNFFDFLDTITANWMLTTVCLVTSIFIGWFADKRRIKDAIINGNPLIGKLYGSYMFIIKFIVPAMVIALIITKTVQ